MPLFVSVLVWGRNKKIYRSVFFSDVIRGTLLVVALSYLFVSLTLLWLDICFLITVIANSWGIATARCRMEQEVMSSVRGPPSLDRVRPIRRDEWTSKRKQKGNFFVFSGSHACLACTALLLALSFIRTLIFLSPLSPLPRLSPRIDFVQIKENNARKRDGKLGAMVGRESVESREHEK